MTMHKLILFLLVITTGVSCKNGTEKSFTVQGTISNTTARKVYLEEVPPIMQPTLVDSAEIGKDGKFSLKASAKESAIYNLRLDDAIYPLVSLVNDAPAVTVNIQASQQNNMVAESYEVKGSAASQQMKDFMTRFNNDLQKIFLHIRKIDSLRRTGVRDSLLQPLMDEQKGIAGGIKRFTEQALADANDPSLLLFELGYYQQMANANQYGIEPLNDEKVNEIVNRGTKRFSSHNGIAAVNEMLERHLKERKEQMQKELAASFVGKQAPDFSLPDVNGKEVKLSSFRGKYVLIDFWASWCPPCRQENPNLVQAYQRYKDKNFTVLGVSLERPGQKDNWLKAIENDKLAWTQVSDLQFWNSAVVPLYGLTEIPFNVLVDPNGKVVAQKLRGAELETRLAEILGN